MSVNDLMCESICFPLCNVKSTWSDWKCIFVQREKAFAKYQYAIEEKKHNEAQEQKAKDENKKIEEELQLHKVDTDFMETFNWSASPFTISMFLSYHSRFH